MQPTDSNGSNNEARKPITRRQLLASLGAAGLLLASGAGLPGQAAAAPAVPGLDNSLVYNVKDYGAQGLGRYNQDDTPYIQAAISAASAGGGTVYLPPGEYIIRTSLFLRSNVHLLGAGPGATVIRANGTNIQMVKLLTGVKMSSVKGITFEGSGTGTTTSSALVETGVHVLEAEQIQISGCVFSKIVNAVHLLRSKRVAVTHNSVIITIGSGSPYEGYGVIVEGGSANTVQTNFFTNMTKNAVLLSAGSAYSLIANNVIEGCKEEAILVSSKLTPCSHHLIQGNQISAAGLIDQETSCTYGIRLKDYCSFNTVSNNAVSRSASAGIQLDAGENNGDDRPYGNTITGNTINRSVRGIAVLNGDANSLKNNEVRNVENGILLDTVGEGNASSAKRNAVIGNTLFQCSVSAVKIGTARCQENQVFGNGGFDNKAAVADSGTDTATSGF